jgi:hypothetical protein
MSCAYHPERDEVDTCTLCERALCEDCTHEIQARTYCEQCLAERIEYAGPGGGAGDGSEGPAATLGGENPGAAFVLGLIPGVGAIYNAEYFKAAAHIVIFALLIQLSDAGFGFGFGVGGPLFGMLAFGFYCYMPFEAYFTAKKRLLLRSGVRLETPFDRINEGLDDIVDKDWWGGITLIVAGLLFLLDNFGILDLNELLRLWPAVLIVIGIWLLKRFRHGEA